MHSKCTLSITYMYVDCYLYYFPDTSTYIIYGVHICSTFPPLSLSPPLSFRWASIGLDFLTLACAPRQLATMSPTNFAFFRKLMSQTLDHVVGEAPPIMGTRSKSPQPTRAPRRSPRLQQGKPPILMSAVSGPHVRTGRMSHLRVEEEEEGGRVEGGEEYWRRGRESEGEDDLRLDSTPQGEFKCILTCLHCLPLVME